ncbi:MAG: hypothetical protein Q4C25_02500 [Bacillota bacterium]|nr:hypothetical protein [Bacillota bacterium]
MMNTELMKAFEKAFSLGNSIPEGKEKETLEALTRQFAESRRINFTDAEVDAAVDYGLTQIPRADEEVSFPFGKMMN